MTYIMVDKTKIKSFENTFKDLSSNMKKISGDISLIGRKLDWEVRAKSNIQGTLDSIHQSLDQQANVLNKMSGFLTKVYKEYDKLDREFIENLDRFKNYTTITPENKGVIGEIWDFFGADIGRVLHLANDWKDIFNLIINYHNKLLPSLASLVSGFQIKKVGDKFIVYGKRTASNYFEDLYLKWRVDPNGMNVNLHTTNGKSLLARKPWKFAWDTTKKDFKGTFKGGGLIANLISVGVNLFDYGWGDEKGEGILSSGFLSSLTVDLLKGTGQTAIASGAGALATSIIAWTTAGTVVPGVGTAVGFAVGLGLVIFDSTPWGQSATNWSKEKLKGFYQSIANSDAGKLVKKESGKIREGAKNIYQDSEEIFSYGINKIGDYIGGWSKNLFSW